MSRASFINTESLYIDPVALCLAEDATLTVHSLKLQLCPNTAQVLVVLALDGAVVFEAAFSNSRGPLRLATPASLLCAPGVPTVHVVLCDAEGRISDIVDSGKVLVLPKDAAEEVKTLFANIKQDVQQYLPSGGSSQPALVQQQQQQQQQRQVPQPDALPQLWRTWHSVIGRLTGSSSSQGNAQAAVPASSSTQPGTAAAGATSNSSAVEDNAPAAAAAATGGSSTASVLNAAALYAYEHFLVPFVRSWEAVLLSCAAHRAGSSSAAASVTAGTQAARLLLFMLDNELWSSAVLLLGQVPALADHASSSGLDVPADFCAPIILGCLRAALSPPHAAAPQQRQQQSVHRQSPPVGAADRAKQLLAAQAGVLLAMYSSQQQQQQQLGLDARLTASSLQALHMQQQQLAGYGVLRYTRELSPTRSNELSNSVDESSFESASEILRRVLLLQQLRCEQEALAELQQQQDGAYGPSAEQQQRSHSSVSMQQALLQAQYAAASPAFEQRPLAVQSTVAAAGSGLEDAAAQMTTLEVAAAVAAEADAAEQDILAQMASAERLEGSFAVTDPCLWQQAALAAEGPAMVPKLRPPKPEQTYLEGSLLRVSSKTTGRKTEAPDAVVSCSSSNGSFMQQQQLHQQQRQVLRQQCVAGAAAAAQAAVCGLAFVPVGAPGAAAPAALPGSAQSATEQQQQQEAAGAAVYTQPSGHDGSNQWQQRSHCIEDMLWQEVTAAAPPAAAVESSGCADTTCSAADSCDRSVCDSDYEALAEYEASCCSRSPASSEAAAEAAAAAAALAAARVAADYGQDSCSKPWQRQQLPHGQQLTLTQQVVGGVQLAVSGFEDPCLESSYVVFKNHSSALLDTTALLICGGMLAAATMRSVDFRRDPEALGKLGMVLLYGALFFFPYALMQLRRQLFLRHREVLLVLARTMTAFLVILVAVKAVPQPNAWVSVVGNTLALQLQNGVILPSCQQLRLPAAAAIAAAHLPSDALMLALAMPVQMAVLSSLLMQLCMLLVTIAQDAWCRHRFLQRYLGVAKGAGPVRPAARHVQGGAAAADRSCAARAVSHASGNMASGSSASVALRQRRPLQRLS